MKRGSVFLAMLLVIVTLPYIQASTTIVSSPWKYLFSSDGTLYEAGPVTESSSPYFWVNSGAKLILSGGRGMTIHGELPANDYWRALYAQENYLDTDNGLHPQNIFRLVTKSKWKNAQETAYFKITDDILSLSTNRAEHNGLLLMSRYSSNGDTLYYAGVRVDGNAIIKKKINGQYYTLASNKILPGTYHRENSPNLLPKNIWIGLRSQVMDNTDGSVTIKLYIDKNWNNNWVLIAEAIDKTNPIRTDGYAGIRTDFMNVVFDNYELISS